MSLDWEVFTPIRECGVYMLMNADEILYVGQSTDIEYRVACHRKAGKIPFTWVKYAKIPKSKLDHVEQDLIRKHEPKYNTAHTKKAHKARGPRNWMGFPIVYPDITLKDAMRYSGILEEMASEVDPRISSSQPV